MKIEIRITHEGNSLSGASYELGVVEQTPETLAAFIQDAVKLLAASALRTLNDTVKEPPPRKGDPDAASYLRRFADFVDSGKYVVAVNRRPINDTTDEITLLLDKKKS